MDIFELVDTIESIFTSPITMRKIDIQSNALNNNILALNVTLNKQIHDINDIIEETLKQQT